MKAESYSGGSFLGRVGMDTGIAIVALVLGAAFLALSTVVSTILALMIPMAIVSASVLYLSTKWYGVEVPAREHFVVSDRIGHGLRLATVVGLAGMVFVGTLTGGRTIPFFGIAILVYGLIFGQIFFVEAERLRPGSVLVQVIAFAVVLRGVALLTTPGLIGIDVWVHITDYAAAISEQGELAAIGDTKYVGAPLYHLLVVTAADTIGTSLRTGLYATVGLVVPLSALFVFYTSKYVVPVRWALFATAAFAISDRFVLWGIHLIPTSMGLVFFLGVVYATTKVYMTGSRWPYALVILFGLATILTHHISTTILLVFLGVGALIQLTMWLGPDIFGIGRHSADRRAVNFLGLLLVLLPVTIVDWSLSPAGDGSFLSVMLTRAGAGLTSLGAPSTGDWGSAVPTPIEGLVTTVPTSVQALFAMGLTVLLMISLVGVFTLFRRRRLDLLTLTWIGSFGVMLFVVLGMPLLGMEFLIPSRWTAFLYVPMVLLGAVGLWQLTSSVTRRQAVSLLLVIALLFTVPMLVDHKATIEKPVFEDYQLTPAYSDAELDAAQTIGTIHPTGETIQADKPYYLLLRDWQQLSPRPEMLSLSDAGTVTGSHVVYRTRLAEHSPMVGFEGQDVRAELPIESVCRPDMDVIYSNGDVHYCRGA